MYLYADYCLEDLPMMKSMQNKRSGLYIKVRDTYTLDDGMEEH